MFHTLSLTHYHKCHIILENTGVNKQHSRHDVGNIFYWDGSANLQFYNLSALAKSLRHPSLKSPTAFGAHPASNSIRTGDSFTVSVKLAIHIHLMPKLEWMEVYLHSSLCTYCMKLHYEENQLCRITQTTPVFEKIKQNLLLVRHAHTVKGEGGQ